MVIIQAIWIVSFRENDIHLTVTEEDSELLKNIHVTLSASHIIQVLSQHVRKMVNRLRVISLYLQRTLILRQVTGDGRLIL